MIVGKVLTGIDKRKFNVGSGPCLLTVSFSMSEHGDGIEANVHQESVTRESWLQTSVLMLSI